MELKDQNIFIISNEPWGEIWFSKHNYAYELSKNNKVFFFNPCRKWSLKNLFSFSITSINVSQNLEVINYQNILPSLNLWLFKLNNYLISFLLKNYFHKRGIKKNILWNFDPCRLYDGILLNSTISIFHSVDEHNFRHPGEKLLAKKSDFIFCISREFLKTYLPYNKSVYLVPHGISEEEFKIEEEQKKLDIPYTNFGLYVGNIDERMDLEQLDLVLKSFPETDFVFVGKNNTTGENELEKKIFKDNFYKNLHLIGPRHFKQLKPYIAASKFCIAFMTNAHWGNRISHHKIFQYLALGKPVFSCVFSEYKEADTLLYMENDTNLLVEKLNCFLQNGEDSSLVQERIKYAQKHRFDAIFKKVEDILNLKQ